MMKVIIDILSTAWLFTIQILKVTSLLFVQLSLQVALTAPIIVMMKTFTSIELHDKLGKAVTNPKDPLLSVQEWKAKRDTEFRSASKVFLSFAASFFYPLLLFKLLPSFFIVSQIATMVPFTISIVYMIDQGVWRHYSLGPQKSIFLFYPVIVMYMYCVLYIIG